MRSLPDQGSTTFTQKKCKCYANAFIAVPNSISTVVRTFTQEEITGLECLTVPLTTICDGTLLQINQCKSPQDKWCRIIDQGNGFITSLQVPKGCGGCYNFDLSASVALTAIFTLTVALGSPPVFFFSSSANLNVPVKASLKLSEQLPREICVADEVAEIPERCFTAVTLPLIDTAMASQILAQSSPFSIFIRLINLSTSDIGDVGRLTRLGSEDPFFSNLAVSGTVCLRDCQRLVPTLTLQPFNFSFIRELLDVPIDVLSMTDIKLHLADLSLKLKRIENCPEDCQCKRRD